MPKSKTPTKHQRNFVSRRITFLLAHLQVALKVAQRQHGLFNNQSYPPGRDLGCSNETTVLDSLFQQMAQAFLQCRSRSKEKTERRKQDAEASANSCFYFWYSRILIGCKLMPIQEQPQKKAGPMWSWMLEKKVDPVLRVVGGLSRGDFRKDLS